MCLHALRQALSTTIKLHQPLLSFPSAPTNPPSAPTKPHQAPINPTAPPPPQETDEDLPLKHQALSATLLRHTPPGVIHLLALTRTDCMVPALPHPTLPYPALPHSSVGKPESSLCLAEETHFLEVCDRGTLASLQVYLALLVLRSKEGVCGAGVHNRLLECNDGQFFQW